ncbi:hypothetical protein L6R52_08185 [Myxococcota bacterium]|nr:hypothetical protein [Myxococcota bacterium]
MGRPAAQGVSAAEKVAELQRFQRLITRSEQLDRQVSSEVDRLNRIPAASPRRAAEAEPIRARVIEQLRVHGQMNASLEALRRTSAHPNLAALQHQVQQLAEHAAENLIALNQLTGRRPDDAR